MSGHPNDSMRAHRRDMTSEFGASILDAVIVDWSCPGCGAELADSQVRTIAAVPYRDVGSLVASASKMSDAWLSDPPACEACGRPGEQQRSDYHSFHATAGRDLVVRLEAGAEPALLWWDPERGHVPAAPTESESEALEIAALMRQTVVLGLAEEDPQAQAFLDRQLEAAVASRQGDPLLLDLLPVLMGRGLGQLAGEVCDGHMAAHPDDPRGFAAMGELVAMAINHGALPPESLPEAERHLQRALELDTRHPGALMTLGTLRRMQEDTQGARACYERVLEAMPHLAEARFNLGGMLLDDDPSAALRQFEQGEALVPDDPDYPLGVARAHARLGSLPKAREAIERARGIDPDYPRTAEIAAALGLI